MNEEFRKSLNLKMDYELYEKAINFIAQKELITFDIKTVQLHFRTGYYRAARIVEHIRLEQGITGNNINKD